MQPAYVTKSLVAASANNIATSQTPGAAGPLTLNGSTVSGGVATLDTQRQVILTLSGNETGKTFTLKGTNDSGAPISETIAGATAGVLTSVNSYKTITSVAISAAAAGAITVGTNGVGVSAWKNLNLNVSPFNVGLAVVISGTVNFTVNYTYEDPNNPVAPSGPVAFAITALSAKAANTDGGLLNIPVAAVQLVINSGTGSATLVVDQAGVGSP